MLSGGSSKTSYYDEGDDHDDDADDGDDDYEGDDHDDDDDDHGEDSDEDAGDDVDDDVGDDDGDPIVVFFRVCVCLEGLSAFCCGACMCACVHARMGP